MTSERVAELRNLLEATDRSLMYVIGRILLEIAVELDRIAEVQEEAHK